LKEEELPGPKGELVPPILLPKLVFPKPLNPPKPPIGDAALLPAKGPRAGTVDDPKVDLLNPD
jgi:hypothetical protein